MKWKTKNGMKDLELKKVISFDEELPEYDENNPTPTCFSRWYDIQKYYYHGKNTTTNSNYQKKIKNNLTTSFKNGPNLLMKQKCESTMVVIGKIPLTRKRNVTNESQKRSL